MSGRDSSTPTSREVAKAAGVSQATVSRVLHESTKVLPQTREKVRKALTELGYTPNLLARAMRTRRTDTVGVIVASVTNPFYPEIIEALDARLSRAGSRMLLLTSDGLGENNAVEAVQEGFVDGLIFTTATTSTEPLAAALARQRPIVLINRGIATLRCDQVTADNVGGGRAVARYLYHSGHRAIGCIGGLPGTGTMIEREQGFHQELREHGVTLGEDRYRGGEFSHDAAYWSAREILTGREQITALFCVNDLMAFGAIDAARALNIAVPDDLWIVGFDDIRMTAWESFDLTTVRQPIPLMVDTAVDLLLTRIEDPARPPATIQHASELIVRGSTAHHPPD